MDRPNNASGGTIRDNSISFVRLVAMLMIVTCHIMQYYECELAWWFNVGVQMFFFISGWLYGPKEIDDGVGFVLRGAKKILIDYWIYLIVMIALYVVLLPGKINAQAIVLSLSGAGTITGLGHLWFVAYIMFCYVLTPAIFRIAQRAEKHSRLAFMAIGVLVCIVVALYGTIYNSFFKSAWIICYFIGYWLSRGAKSYSNKLGVGKYLAFALPLCIVTNSVKIYLEYVRTAPLHGVLSRTYEYFKPYCHVILGATLFLALYMIFRKTGLSELKGVKRITAFSDKYSYQVYICHLAFILGEFSILRLPLPPFAAVILACIASVLSAIVLHFCGQAVRGIITKK